MDDTERLYTYISTTSSFLGDELSLAGSHLSEPETSHDTFFFDWNIAFLNLCGCPLNETDGYVYYLITLTT
jgi:hypothetical protein